jgi:threonine dehydrogenase-like Zn-dependent dehydrogenase
VTRLGGVVSSVGVYAGLASLPLATDGSFMHRTIVTTLCPAGKQAARRPSRVARLRERSIRRRCSRTARPLERIVEAYDLFRSRADGVIKIAIT